MCASIPTPLRITTEFTQEIVPRRGVVTLFGYGIKVHVDRGHLTIQDGIGEVRRHARFSRVGHGLKRLIVIGSDGLISLAALRWLSDQKAAFVMLDRTGKNIAVSGPVFPSDAKLRRAQATANDSGLGLSIARELISQKLIAQQRVILKHFQNSSAAFLIVNARNRLASAMSSEEIRLSEAQGALAYWSAWHSLPVNYSQADLPRTPIHWRRFGSRISVLTQSPRLAVNPPNAILNYLYALLESESRLALSELGLDPGIGVLHSDTKNRDSLACDLMEPVRPQVDSFVLQWLKETTLAKRWFFEERNGNCRLMAGLAKELAETSKMWRHALAPYAEGIARSLWSRTIVASKNKGFATRLTQTHKRDAKGIFTRPPEGRLSTLPSSCGVCSASIKSGFRYCRSCLPSVSKQNILKAAAIGRLMTHKPEAQARRAKTQQRQNAALKAWNPADQPTWLDDKAYLERVQPKLVQAQVPQIMSAISVSEPYALSIRAGRRLPHARHWLKLARLIGIEG